MQIKVEETRSGKPKLIFVLWPNEITSLQKGRTVYGCAPDEHRTEIEIQFDLGTPANQPSPEPDSQVMVLMGAINRQPGGKC